MDSLTGTHSSHGLPMLTEVYRSCWQLHRHIGCSERTEKRKIARYLSNVLFSNRRQEQWCRSVTYLNNMNGFSNMIWSKCCSYLNTKLSAVLVYLICVRINILIKWDIELRKLEFWPKLIHRLYSLYPPYGQIWHNSLTLVNRVNVWPSLRTGFFNYDYNIIISFPTFSSAIMSSKLFLSYLLFFWPNFLGF